MPTALKPGDDRLSRIPLVPSMTDKLMASGEELLEKADYLMVRFGGLLNNENSKNIGDILANLNKLTSNFSQLQNSLDKAMAGVPALTRDSQKTLANINILTQELQGLSHEAQNLSIKTVDLVNTGEATIDILLQTTLPRVNKVLVELQSTAQQIKRAATMLDNNPQESGYREESK
jgi:phospholipid/cholesterol/gamma-HCH transport system substrate-binding protein